WVGKMAKIRHPSCFVALAAVAADRTIKAPPPRRQGGAGGGNIGGLFRPANGFYFKFSGPWRPARFFRRREAWPSSSGRAEDGVPIGWKWAGDADQLRQTKKAPHSSCGASSGIRLGTNRNLPDVERTV